MKSVLVTAYVVFVLLWSGLARAQVATDTIVPPKASLVAVAQAVMAQPTDLTVKDAALVPPTWMQDVVVEIKTLPVVGPIAVKAFQWLAILCSVLTALCACIIAVARTLAMALNMANLSMVADKIQSFEDGKIMYWLKYASMFNAQPNQVVAAPEPKLEVVAAPEEKKAA